MLVGQEALAAQVAAGEEIRVAAQVFLVLGLGVRERGVGRVIKRFAGIRPAVQALQADLPALRANVQRLDNRAVFEVPQVLADILAQRSRAPSPECRATVTVAT